MSLETQREEIANSDIMLSIIEGDVKEAIGKCLKFIKESYGDNAINIWILKYFCQNFVSEDPEFRSEFDKNVLKVMKLLPELYDSHGVNIFYTSQYFTTEQLEEIEDAYVKFRDSRKTKNRCKYFIEEIRKLAKG